MPLAKFYCKDISRRQPNAVQLFVERQWRSEFGVTWKENFFDVDNMTMRLEVAITNTFVVASLVVVADLSVCLRCCRFAKVTTETRFWCYLSTRYG